MNNDPGELTNFTAIPNELLEKLISSKLTGRELRIVLFVIRKTLGWCKSKDKISLSQFYKNSGIRRDNSHRILKELLKKKIIKKSVATQGYKKPITYSINENFNEWNLSPSTTTPQKRKPIAIDGHKLLSPVATDLSPSTTTTKEIRTKELEQSGSPCVSLQDTDSPIWEGHFCFNNTDYIVHTSENVPECEAKRILQQGLVEKYGFWSDLVDKEMKIRRIGG